jgi:hypothetical protein
MISLIRADDATDASPIALRVVKSFNPVPTPTPPVSDGLNGGWTPLGFESMHFQKTYTCIHS